MVSLDSSKDSSKGAFSQVGAFSCRYRRLDVRDPCAPSRTADFAAVERRFENLMYRFDLS